MENFNSFWPVYKNLEEETLQLTKYINFSDDQLKVYSMHIADLIMRIVVEIEALSKELYKINGGPELFDDEGNARDLFFDTDCINYLNDNWKICDRNIIVACSNFNFINEQYRILSPLKKANKRGTSSAKYNKAYQAVKHDRRNNLKKGNIENLIQALGALYILNIYYRDDIEEYGTINLPNKLFDFRLGPDIFSATFADATNVAIESDSTDTAINEKEREKMSTSLCIIKYNDEAWKNVHDELIKYNTELINGLIKNPEFIQKVNENSTNSNNNLESHINSIVEKMKIDYIRENPPRKFGKLLLTAKKEVIVNKGKSVYKTNS